MAEQGMGCVQAVPVCECGARPSNGARARTVVHLPAAAAQGSLTQAWTASEWALAG